MTGSRDCCKPPARGLTLRRLAADRALPVHTLHLGLLITRIEVADAADQLVAAQADSGKAWRDGYANQFAHLRPLDGTLAHHAIEPAKVVAHLGERRSAAGNRSVAGDDLLPGQRLQLLEVAQPDIQPRRPV